MMDGQAKTKEEGDALRAMYASMVPMGRLGRPEEIAAAAFFLASDESSYCVTDASVPPRGAALISGHYSPEFG
jgi:NAD(P)-dependent dehydrogenase (short-subunit alcohol dehydrogenase family)